MWSLGKGVQSGRLARSFSGPKVLDPSGSFSFPEGGECPSRADLLAAAPSIRRLWANYRKHNQTQSLNRRLKPRARRCCDPGSDWN